MVALQKRLIKELKTVGVNQVGALTSKWLLALLEIHDFNIPQFKESISTLGRYQSIAPFLNRNLLCLDSSSSLLLDVI